MLGNTPSSQETKKTKLLSILNSRKDEKEIKKQIFKELKEDPTLIHETYVLERSLFHILILYKFTKITNTLLKDKQVLSVAKKCDRKKKTILHYAVETKHYSHETLSLIIEKLPELVNQCDQNAQSPLHIAMQEKNAAAVKLLIQKGKANPHLVDKYEKEASDYTGDDTALKAALIPLDKNNSDFSAQYPILTKKEKSAISIKNLSKKFSVLKLGSSSATRSESDGFKINTSFILHDDGLNSEPLMLTTNRSMPEASIHSLKPIKRTKKYSSFSNIYHNPMKHKDHLPSLGIAVDDLSNGLYKKLNAYLSAGGNPNEMLSSGSSKRSLIEWAFLCATDNFRTREIDYDLQQQFFNLLSKAFLEPTPSFIHLARNTKNSFFLLQSALKKLRFNLFEIQKKHDKKLNCIVSNIERGLFDAGLGQLTLESLPSKNYHSISGILNIAPDLILYIDQICACMKSNDDINPQFSKELISSYTLGLRNFLSPKAIVDCLFFLMPNFSFSQKLVACLMVKELIEWDVHHELSDKDFYSAVENFTLSLQKYTGIKIILDISDDILQLLQEKNNFSNHVVVKNYICLQKCLVEHTDLEHLQDIQQKTQLGISSTLAPKIAQKKEIISFLANEFRAFSIMFYQNLNIQELFQEAWKRDEKETNAPNIVQQMQYYNNSTNWIINITLMQNPEDIPLVMNFFVEVAQSLSKITDGIGPDLNSIMNVMSAFTKGPISRLKTQLTELDSVFTELSMLTSSSSNYKWLRKVNMKVPSSIPFFGIFTKDIISANENKGLPLIYTLGQIFREILLIQNNLKFEPAIFNSNLNYLLTRHPQLDDESMQNHQYAASYQTSPPPLNLDSINHIDHFFEKLDDIIEKKYIPYPIQHNNKQCSTNTFILALIERFHMLNTIDDEGLRAQQLKKMGGYTTEIQIILDKKYKNTQNKLLIQQKLFNSSQHLRTSEASETSEPSEAPLKAKKRKSSWFGTYRA